MDKFKNILVHIGIIVWVVYSLGISIFIAYSLFGSPQ